MDTRLKNSKTRSGIYAAVFITEVIAACALTVAATIFSALGTMSWAKDISPDDWHFYTGNIIDQSKYDQLQNNIGIWGNVGYTAGGRAPDTACIYDRKRKAER